MEYRRAVICEELVKLTGDDLSALILRQLIFWSTRVKHFDAFLKEEKERNPSNNTELLEGWIFKSTSQLKDEIMYSSSENTIRRRIKKNLVANGWVHERNNPRKGWDRTLQYRPDLLQIERDLNELDMSLASVMGKDYYRVKSAFKEKESNLHGEECNPHNEASSLNGEDSNLNGEDSNLHDDEAIPKTNTKSTKKNTKEKGKSPDQPSLIKSDPEKLLDFIENAEDEFGEERYKRVKKMPEQLTKEKAERLFEWSLEEFPEHFPDIESFKIVLVRLLDKLEKHKSVQKNLSVYDTLRTFIRNYVDWNDPELDQKTGERLVDHSTMLQLFQANGLGGTLGSGFSTEDVFKQVKKNGETKYAIREDKKHLIQRWTN